MLSRSPSPSTLFQDPPTNMDDGFMVVPVWEPSAEVQIGSVVLEDPFLGFGPTSATALPTPSKAFAVTTADAAFVGANGQPTQPPAPVAAHYAQPYPPPPQPSAPAPYAQQPQPQPVPYAQPAQPQPAQQPVHQQPRPAPADDFFSEESVVGGVGWWEESGPVSAFDAVEGSAPDLLSHQDSVEAFLGYPEQSEVTLEASGVPVAAAASPLSSSPLKSPEDILNEIYAEANQLESEASERGISPSEESAWWEDSATDESPEPLEAAFDDSFQQEVLQAVSSSSGRAVLSLDAGSLPAEALTSGGQLNLVLHIKEPASRKRQGPKIRATVSIAPAPAEKKRKKGTPAPPSRLRKGEAKERKKAQNRVAATKYREKKRSARDILLRELEVEEERRDRLKRKEEDAVNEIAYLRDLLKKVQTKKEQEIVL